MIVVVYILGLIAVMLALEGFSAHMRIRRAHGGTAARKRLREMSERLQSPEVAGEDSLLRKVQKQRHLLESLLARIPGREQIELKLYRAQVAISPERFLALSAGLALGGWLLGGILLRDPGTALICTGLGVLPWVYVGRRSSRRSDEFARQFPDALDLLIRALRAGHSLSSGFAMIGKELPEPIGSEFSQTADEIQLGQTMRVALENLAYRVESPDLPFFVTAISIQQETGSNLAEVLQNLSTVMRDRFKILGKVRALTAMGRGSANLLGAWPMIAVGCLYATNPDYVAPLWETDTGHMLVLISTVMVIVGYVLCRKMATIRV